MNGNRIVAAAVGLGTAALIAGCEWSGGGSATSLTDRYGWANFSGLYRGPNGGRIVTDYTSAAGTAGLDQYKSGVLANIGPGTNVYQGVLKYKIIAEGTVTILGPNGLQWSDDGAGTLTAAAGTGAIDGTINYITGAWRVEIANPVPAGQLTVSYVWIGDGTQQGISRPGSGATGGDIMNFLVVQEGNELSLTDNNGAVFTGRFGSVSTNTGANRDTPINSIVPVSGTEIIAQFTVKGVSAAGVQVTIVGYLHATADVDAQTGVVTSTDRQMFGTWIEKNGRTGDIVGEALPAAAAP